MLTAAPSTVLGNASSSVRAQPFPVTIKHQFGRTTIAKAPRRVVALTDDDFVVALGVVPVAIPRNPYSSDGKAPWLAAALGARRPQLLNVQSGYPFEKIAALKPDLIVGAVTNNNYAILSKIAPTIEYVRGPNTDTWQDRTRLLGRALGRSTVAERVVARVTGQIAKARTRYASALARKRFSLSLNYASGVVSTVRSPSEASVQFLAALGLALSPKVTRLPDSGGGRSDVSVERLDVLDTDLLMMAHITPTLRRSIEANRLFGGLGAVKKRRYVALTVPNLLALSRPSALNIPFALGHIVPGLARALSQR